eukprot:15361796-Ditylum_brightwellii.AAC.1
MWVKSECSTGSSEESVSESEEEDDKEVDISKELLDPHMVQTIPSLLEKKKGVVELEEDESSNSESDVSAFQENPFKKLKKESPVANPAVKKSRDNAVVDKTEILSVALSVLMSDKKNDEEGKKDDRGEDNFLTLLFLEAWHGDFRALYPAAADAPAGG